MSTPPPPDPLAAFAASVRQHFPGATLTRYVVKLNTARDRLLAHRAIDKAPPGYVVDLHEERRSDEQNRALWPRLTEIHKQRPSLNGAAMTPDLWKCVFLQATGAELRMMPTLAGDGFFPLGLSSSALTKTEFANLLSFIDAWCAEQGITLRQQEAA